MSSFNYNIIIIFFFSYLKFLYNSFNTQKTGCTIEETVIELELKKNLVALQKLFKNSTTTLETRELFVNQIKIFVFSRFFYCLISALLHKLFSYSTIKTIVIYAKQASI